MLTAMGGPDSKGHGLLKRISQAVVKEARANLSIGFTEWLSSLVREFEAFDEHISERLLQDYELTSLDNQIRESLQSVLPWLENWVLDLQSSFEELEIKEEMTEGEDCAPPAKKQKRDDQPELPPLGPTTVHEVLANEQELHEIHPIAPLLPRTE
jgi:hypothetical protein